MKCDSMNIITATSYMARDIAINVLRSGHFNPDEYTIKYNLGDLLIFCATAGYGGTGPHDMLKILRTAGFPVNEEAILTPNWSHDRQILIKGTMFGMKDILTSTF